MTRRTQLMTCLVFLLATASGAAGESARLGVSKAPTDLSGRWLLTMPAGFEYDATLERAGDDGRYRLCSPATNLNGIYQLSDGHLTATAPENPRMEGLVWELKNRNVLLLTVHPESASVGSDYRNATLSRRSPSEKRNPVAESPELKIEVRPPSRDPEPIVIRPPSSYEGFERRIEERQGKSVLDLLGNDLRIRLQPERPRLVKPYTPWGGTDFVRAILDGRIVSRAKIVYHLQPNAQECIVTTPEGDGRVGIFYPPVGYVVLPSGESYWFLFGDEPK